MLVHLAVIHCVEVARYLLLAPILFWQAILACKYYGLVKDFESEKWLAGSVASCVLLVSGMRSKLNLTQLLVW